TAASFGLITASLRGLDRNKHQSAAQDFLQTSINLVRNTPYSTLSASSLQSSLLPLWNQRSSAIGPRATFSISLQNEETNLSRVQCWVGGTIHGQAMTLASTSIRASKGINP
ncbi:MAG TPA: hypothetical protein V6C82_07405, partial [Chroococcales cyanobacterium]